MAIYNCTPRQVSEYLDDIFEAGLVPNIISSPGMGKSSLMKAKAKLFNLELIDIRLSTCAPEDLTGLPEFRTNEGGRRVAAFAPFEMFPVQGTPLPEGKDGWLVFYDEFNSGTKMVQAASYKVILDKMIGQARLHERVAQGCAGNLMTDRAITNNLSTAMQSRLVTLQMVLSHKEWLLDVAFAENYDERIIAFLNYEEDYLMDFRPDHQDTTFCCPRTWEFMNRLIKGKEVSNKKIGLYAGSITSNVAAAFVEFCAVYTSLISVREVLANPEGAHIPPEPTKQWALISHLIGKINDQDLAGIAKYVNRFPTPFRILFFRGGVNRYPKLREHPDFQKAIVELAKYLF